MLRLRHGPPLMAAAVICLAVIGCGGGNNGGAGAAPGPAASGAQGAPAPNGSAGAKGAPVDNGPNGGGGGGTAAGGGARGAPIKIPAIVQSQGVSIDDVMDSLVSGKPLPGESNPYDGIVAQCGGQLCVRLKARPATGVPGADNLTQCQFLGDTDPPAGSVVHPGDTIWLLTGTKPCTAPPDGDQSPGTGSSPPGDQSPGTDGSAGAGQSPADNSSA